jgi:predicted XRE-type DNA-binding protein
MLPIKNFTGKIDGKDIYYFLNQIKHPELSQKERIELVRKVLYTQDGFLDSYFEEVFDQKDIENYTDPTHVKLCVDKKNFLSHEINVCKALEIMTDYILYSPDGERINKKTKYNFYPEKIFERKLAKEDKISDLTSGEVREDFTEDEVIDFLIRKGQNYKKTIEQRVTSKDLRDEELSVLKDYQVVIEKLQTILKRLKENGSSIREQKKVGGLISSLRDDQIMAKDKLKGTIYFKQCMSDSTGTDYDMFDFTNAEHILALLKMPKRSDFSDDLACLIYDLDNLLKQTKFTKNEYIILNLWRDNDETQESIAEKIGVNQSTVSRNLISIANKISNTYKSNYSDWYYLEVEKGEYAMLDGKTYLISQFDDIGNKRHNKS